MAANKFKFGVALTISCLCTPTLLGCSFGLAPVSPHDNSKYTLQDLCNFPKSFFSDQLHYNISKVDSEYTHPETVQIDGRGQCWYEDATGKSGGVDLYHLLLSDTETASNDQTLRSIVVDGTTVTVITDKTPTGTEPYPRVALDATVDGWRGDLFFQGGDEQATQAGARLLVQMIKKLKG